MKKRVFSLLVCAVITAVLCGCVDKSIPVSDSSTPGVVQPDNDRVNPVLEPEPEWDYYESDKGNIVIQSYNGNDEVVTIPDEIDGKPVKRLSTFFSIDNDVTTTLKIPAGVVDISGIDAGNNLTEFIVDAENETYYSKDGCLYHKKEYTLPELIRCPPGKNGEVTVADGTVWINFGAFKGCKGVSSVKLPDSVEHIAAAFVDCTSLETLDIPETVTDISAHAFDGTPFLKKLIEQDPFVVINGVLVDGTTLKGEITIPDNVEKITYGAFAPLEGSNNALKKVTLPKSLTKVDPEAFAECAALEEVVFSEGLESIGWLAFENCSSLKSIEFPSSLTKIRMGAFRGCTSLTSVDIPDGVTSISSEAFQNCENLERVSIPDSLVYTGFDGCFEGCEKLTVTFRGNSYTYDEIEKFYAAVEENAQNEHE